MKRDQRPRRETVDMARRRQQAAGGLIGGSDLPADAQAALLKALCRHLWGLLDKRAHLPGGMTGVELDEEWDMMSVEARAACDRVFEAHCILFARDRTFVEPCRRPLHGMTEGTLRYLLVHPNRDDTVVTEEQLLMMAGIEQ